MKARGLWLMLAIVGGLANGAGAQVKPSSEWADKTVPVEIFAQFPMVDQPRITPDGKWIAAPNPIVFGWDSDEDGVVRIGASGDADTGKQRRTRSLRPAATTCLLP